MMLKAGKGNKNSLVNQVLEVKHCCFCNGLDTAVVKEAVESQGHESIYHNPIPFPEASQYPYWNWKL